MKKLLWSFGLLAIIIALGGCSSSSKTSGSSEAKAKVVGYQMVEKNGVLSDRKAILEKDDVKKIENITADVKWDKTVSVNKNSKEDATFWFIDQDNKEGQKYKVWFNESGSANVQDEKQVWGVLEGENGETLSSIFKSKLNAQ